MKEPRKIRQRRLVAYQRANGISAKDAAFLVGVRRETIEKWERGGDKDYWNQYAEEFSNNVKGAGAEALKLLRDELLPVGEPDPSAPNRIKAASTILTLLVATMPKDPVRHQHLHLALERAAPEAIDLESTKNFLEQRRRILLELSSVRDEEEAAIRGGRMKVIDVE